MKKISSLMFMFLALVVVLAGCGSPSAQAPNTGTAPTTPAAETKEPANLLEKVKADGKLLIGTEGTYAPFTFHDQSGKLTGFDVEISEEIAKRLGVKAEFMETQWDAMFAGLDSKRFDMIANQVGIRPDRQEKYDFSNPYIVSSAVLVTHTDNTTVKGFEDIKGLKAAQTLTSNLTEIAKQNGAEIVAVEGFNQAIDLLASKRVDVTINDGLSLLDFLKQKPDTPIKIVAKHSDVAKNGLMFRKGSTELVDAVNKALDEMQKDGTYLQISEKWFGADVSK